MPRVEFAPEAAEEFLEAQAWYGGEAAVLARQFRDAVNRVVMRIADNPLQFPGVYRQVRFSVLAGFP